MVTVKKLIEAEKKTMTNKQLKNLKILCKKGKILPLIPRPKEKRLF